MNRTLLSIFSILLVGCSASPDNAPRAESSVVFVSVIPQAWLLDQLVPDGVAVEALVGPGQSPETYSVTPRQMDQLGRAALFFRIGMPFENSLIERVRASAPQLLVVDLRDGIEMIESGDHDDHDHDGHDHGDVDPHVWMDPRAMIQMADTAAAALARQYPDNATAIGQRRDALGEKLSQTDAQVAEILAACAGRAMYVFHPAYGYFANRYGLLQVSIEHDGKGPGTKRLQELAGEIAAQAQPAVFSQPQSSNRAASTLAESTGATLHLLDPLAEDYAKNLIEIAGVLRDVLCPDVAARPESP